MSPTLIYDPEVITTTPAVSRADSLAQRRAPIRKPTRLGSTGPSFRSPRFLALLLVVPSALFIIGLMLVAAEVALGLIGLGDDEYVKVDPVLGITHLENKWVDFRHEGFSRAKISSAGLRDVEHQVAKPAGVKRIAFLGDSKTQALQVNIEDTFVRLVENDLNSGNPKGSQKKFETINFGMSNYGLVQYYVNFLARVRQYSPDVTVVVYHIFDSSDNIAKPGMKSMPAPTVSLNKTGDLSINYTLLDAWFGTEGGRYMIASEWWRRNCHLFQASSAVDFMLRNTSKWCVNINKGIAPIFTCWHDASGDAVLQKTAFAADGDWQATRSSIVDETRVLDKQVSHDDVWTWSVKAPGNNAGAVRPIAEMDSYKLMHDTAKSHANLGCRVLRVLNLACRNAGSKLVIVTLPAPDSMVFYQREIETLKRLGQKEGITVIDANAQFPSLSVMQDSPLYYQTHFSPAGHRKLAGIIAEGLKPLFK